ARPERTAERPDTVGWMVAQWVAIALAALVAHGVASAAGSDESPSPAQGRCFSGQVDAACGGTEPGRVIDVAPPDDCDFVKADEDGAWLCRPSR
ncbi:MAG: hypothetical protein LC792_11110, partial [Actinobacteria bacterium]|nr:hypothetical protein [Actinomycetota bacterium]